MKSISFLRDTKMKKFKLLLPMMVAVISFTGCSMLENKFGKIAPSDAISIGGDLVKAATLSDEEVQKMAHQVAEEMDRSNTIAEPNSTYSKRLSKLVANYKNEDSLKLNYKVYVSPEVNAFSLADGTIRVYSALMDKMNDEELLFVIGHEIGHVKSGHSKVRMQRAYAAHAATNAAGASLASGMGNSAGGVAAAIGGEMLAKLASQVIKAQFSQSDETESDEYGAQFLHRHHHNTQAAVAALRKLGDDEASDGESMMAQFTSSHPNPIERSEHITEYLALMGSSPTSGAEEQKVQMAKHETHAPASPAIEAASERSTADSKVVLNAAPKHFEKSSTPASSQQLNNGWYIQLAAYPDQSTAENMKNALREREERATLQHTVVKGNEYERVLVGPYPTRNNATIELNRVIAHGIFDGEPFVRRLPE